MRGVWQLKLFSNEEIVLEDLKIYVSETVQIKKNIFNMVMSPIRLVMKGQILDSELSHV